MKAFELPKTFKKRKAFDQVEFWKHSLTPAFISRSLAFEDPPEEGYLDALQISQKDLDIVIDTTKIALMAAGTLLPSH